MAIFGLTEYDTVPAPTPLPDALKPHSGLVLSYSRRADQLHVDGAAVTANVPDPPSADNDFCVDESI